MPCLTDLGPGWRPGGGDNERRKEKENEKRAGKRGREGAKHHVSRPLAEAEALHSTFSPYFIREK